MLWQVIFSAVLLALSFSFSNLWILTWISLVPFFFAIQSKTLKQTFWISYLTGILFWLGTIYWLIHVSLVGLILMILYLALFFAVFGLCSNANLRGSINSPSLEPSRAKSRDRFPISFILVPAIWVSLEYLRSYLFGGFGWALLGYSQYTNLPIIQIADITGAFGVSFLIVMCNVIIYQIFKKQNYRIPALVFIVLLSFSLFYGFNCLKNPLEGEELKISVIQGNIPQENKWDEKFKKDILEKYKVLTHLAEEDKPDLIIWPETSVPGYLLEEQKLYDEVTSLAKEVNTNLLVGTPVFERDSGKSFNSAVLFSKEGKVIQMHHKLHLVPFGEFVPFENLLFFIRKVVLIGDFIPGKIYTLFSLNNSKFGALICFEDIFSDLVRRFVQGGAIFMVNITNDAWFKKTTAPYQHLQASVFRAVENRINVVRSANTGYSGFIAPTGKIINRVHKEKEEIGIAGFATQDLTVFSRERFKTVPHTFYTRFGDIFALSCLFLCLISLITAKVK